MLLFCVSPGCPMEFVAPLFLLVIIQNPVQRLQVVVSFVSPPGVPGSCRHARRGRAKGSSAAGKRLEETRPQVRHGD